MGIGIDFSRHIFIESNLSRYCRLHERALYIDSDRSMLSRKVIYNVLFYATRVSDSPIDLKLDLFNPAIKRLHIDIPARPIQLPPGPGPAAPGFDQHMFSSRPDDASTSSSSARDLSVDRNSALTAPAIGPFSVQFPQYCFRSFSQFSVYWFIPQCGALRFTGGEISWVGGWVTVFL